MGCFSSPLVLMWNYNFAELYEATKVKPQLQASVEHDLTLFISRHNRRCVNLPLTVSLVTVQKQQP